MSKLRFVVRVTIACAIGANLDAALAQTSPSLILGRPTDDSVTVNVRVNPGSVYFEWGTSSGSYAEESTPSTIEADPVRVELDGLAPDTRYYYRALYRPSGQAEYAPGPEGTFQTQRARGSGFVFTIQADSHQGYAPFFDQSLYAIAMQNQLADAPDFLVDLGDTFSLDGANEQTSTVRQKYLDQRDVFALASHSVPVFLVLGNHENEEGWNLDDTANPAASLPVMGVNARKRYFANPVPDDFYSGNEDTSVPSIEGDGLKEDYYAFEWGDALFVMLDPFWYTIRKPFTGTLGGEANDEVVGDRWDWTLGFEQYEWLRRTLEASHAPYRFVFAHHLAGGTEDYSRGGANGAPFCEWGGFDTNGTTWSFDEKRPEFVAPVHDLFVANGVSAFFHGHDHAFATEELDGVIYQLCPHAANEDYGTGFGSNQAAYAPAEVLPNSGHLRVSVTAQQTFVEYVRAYRNAQEGDNGEVAASYSMLPNVENQKPVARDDVAATERLSPVEIHVLDDDEDADGDALTVLGVSQPPRGTASHDGQVVTYTPSICNDATPDEFRYTVKDGRGGSATATVSVTAPCPGNAPVAGDDEYVVLSGERTILDVLANDSDVDGNLVRVPEATTMPSHGTLEALNDGTFAYQSSFGFVGADGFSYEVCDTRGNCDSATVQLDVVRCLNDVHCDDANACTTEQCEDFACVATPVACDDAVSCSVDACDPVAGCRHEAVDGACNDDDLCTADRCDLALGCANEPLDCGEADLCQAPSCDASTGECQANLVDCDDGDPCTLDECDPLAGCLHPPSDGTVCDDGNACTSEDVCSQGACAGVAVECLPELAACRLAQCNPTTGCERSDAPDGTECPSGLCLHGSCLSVPAHLDAGIDAGSTGAQGDSGAVPPRDAGGGGPVNGAEGGVTPDRPDAATTDDVKPTPREGPDAAPRPSTGVDASIGPAAPEDPAGDAALPVAPDADAPLPGTPESAEASCGCRVVGAGRAAESWASLVIAALSWLRRKRYRI